MNWFDKNHGEEPEPAGAEQAINELLNPNHERASILDDDSFVVEPGQVLDNIAQAMERIELDVNTPISIEEDVVSFDELATLRQSRLLLPAYKRHRSTARG